MSYSYILTSNYVSVMNLITGGVTKITRDQPNFESAVELVKVSDFEAVEKMDPKRMINSMSAQVAADSSDFNVRLDGGVVKYRYKDQEEKVLHNAMTDRIINIVAQGFDAKPLIAFMSNLLSNPSKTSIDELYLFLESTGLPITSDGHFIAYKIVGEDYKSIHDGKFENNPGTVVEMPRNEVCDNRNQTCSYGLHFCSKDYLSAYGSHARNNDRVVLVKINPADVVSIPSDYNNAKGRASKYLIWKDITEEGWRETLSTRDYTDSAVETGDWDGVDSTEIVNDSDEDYAVITSDIWMGSEESVDQLLSNLPAPAHTCPQCGSDHVYGKGYNNARDMKRFKCQTCNHNFYEVIL